MEIPLPNVMHIQGKATVNVLSTVLVLYLAAGV